MRKSDLLAELTDVLSDGVSQDLWLLSVGIDDNPWGQYQPLIPTYYYYYYYYYILTTPNSRNTPTTTNLEENEIVDAPGNDGNASMPEQVKRPNP